MDSVTEMAVQTRSVETEEVSNDIVTTYPPSTRARDIERKLARLIGRIRSIGQREVVARAELEACAAERAELLSKLEEAYQDAITSDNERSGNTHARFGVKRLHILELIREAGPSSESDIAFSTGLTANSVRESMLSDIRRGVLSCHKGKYTLTEERSGCAVEVQTHGQGWGDTGMDSVTEIDDYIRELERKFCELELSRPSRYAELAMVFDAIASVYRDLDARTKPLAFGQERVFARDSS